MKKVLKQFIAPIQRSLLSRGMCVGCGMPLSKANREENGEGEEKVTCKCKRVYIYDKRTKSYRRAELNEV